MSAVTLAQNPDPAVGVAAAHDALGNSSDRHAVRLTSEIASASFLVERLRPDMWTSPVFDSGTVPLSEPGTWDPSCPSSPRSQTAPSVYKTARGYHVVSGEVSREDVPFARIRSCSET